MSTRSSMEYEWYEQHRALAANELLLLRDYTITKKDDAKLVFVFSCKDPHTDFSTTRPFRRIEYFHPELARNGAMVALMFDDTEAHASDIISAKGWINHAVLKLQRRLRARFSVKRMLGIMPWQLLESCEGILRHIAEYIPAPVAVAIDDKERFLADIQAQLENGTYFARYQGRVHQNQSPRTSVACFRLPEWHHSVWRMKWRHVLFHHPPLHHPCWKRSTHGL